MKKCSMLLVLGILLLLAGGCSEAEVSLQNTESAEVSAVSRIIKENEVYENYSSDVIYLENSNTYIYIFIAPRLKDDDSQNQYADIWIGDGVSESMYQQQQYLSLDSYGGHFIGDYEFFRYDLVVEDEKHTVLMDMDEGICEDTYYLPGELTYVTGNSFHVEVSSLDAEFDIESGQGIGKTVKEYYFYVDDSGYHESIAEPVTREEVLAYGRAEEVFAHLDEMYGGTEDGVTYEYLLRSNRYIHINIFKVQEGIASCHFETYQYMDGVLMMIGSGQGRYLPNAVHSSFMNVSF